MRPINNHWILDFCALGTCTYATNLTTGEEVSFPNGKADVVFHKEIDLPSHITNPLGTDISNI
jgi:hypothetical protein